MLVLCKLDLEGLVSLDSIYTTGIGTSSILLYVIEWLRRALESKMMLGYFRPTCILLRKDSVVNASCHSTLVSVRGSIRHGVEVDLAWVFELVSSKTALILELQIMIEVLLDDWGVSCTTYYCQL